MGVWRLALLPAMVASWTWKSYPGLDGPCAIRKPALICDPDQILTKEDRQFAATELMEIRRRTECDCFDADSCGNSTTGYTVGIAVTHSVEEIGRRRIGDPSLMKAFSMNLFHRWALGHCGDDALVIICRKCQEVVLVHGDMTARKIPEKVRKAMARQAKHLLTFTNTSLLLHYLLENYATFLANKNHTPSVSMLVLPYQDLSTGVITVMVLTSFLTVAWVMCVSFLIAQFLKRRALRIQAQAEMRSRSSTLNTTQTGKSAVELHKSNTPTPGENTSTIGTCSAHRLTLFSPASPPSCGGGVVTTSGRFNGRVTTARFSLSSADTATRVPPTTPADAGATILVSGNRVGRRRPPRTLRSSFRDALMQRRSWVRLRPKSFTSSSEDRASSSRSGDEDGPARRNDSLPNIALMPLLSSD